MINIDPRSSKPIYEQIIDGIKENIMKGILVPGQKIPSVRELSKIILANPNTVSKAYIELERQKVIDTIAGRGTFVSLDYSPKADEEGFRKIKTSLKDIIVTAHYMGIDRNAVAEMLNQIYEEMERK